MARIIIQAGHEGRTTGSTGAPGEQGFTKDVADKVATKLQSAGFEVRRVTADPTAAQLAGDWDLFLAIHYDADIYGKGGCLVDFPEPSTDGATAQSQNIAKLLLEAYTQMTGIVAHQERSNKNTRYYYMWSKLSAKTPCVLIECGVGQHKPDDYEVLFNQRTLVIDGIVRGIINSLGANMGDLPANYADIIHNSSQWDAVCAVQGLGESRLASADTLNATVAGLKSRITTLGNDLATSQGETASAKDALSACSMQVTHMSETEKTLTNQLIEKQNAVNELTTAKVQMASQLQQALNTIETMKQQATNGQVTITLGDLFQLILKQKITITK